MTGLVVIGALLWTWVVWSVAAGRGWLQGWNEARDVWMPECERLTEKVGDLRRLLLVPIPEKPEVPHG